MLWLGNNYDRRREVMPMTSMKVSGHDHVLLVATALTLYLALPHPVSANEDIRLEPRVQAMLQIKAAPYTKLANGSALTVEDKFAYITPDNGQTWLDPIPLFPDGPDLEVSNERVLTRTRDGAIILAFMNLNSRDWGWDDEKNAPDRDVRLDVWTIRSLDEGRTWQDAQRIQGGWCGAVRDIIQTGSGRVVLTAQVLTDNPPRHVTRTYSSDDDGKTWKPSNILDLGGHGHHDGAIEATIVERRDHRIWMLLRTNLDYFWEAFSDNQGRYWREMRPTRIDASSSPAYLTRLQSGRLVMTWNRLYLEGRNTTVRRGRFPLGNACQLGTIRTFHRFLRRRWADLDGLGRDRPHKDTSQRVSYPWVFERRPGEMWITTMQGGLKCRLFEKDFVK